MGDGIHAATHMELFAAHTDGITVRGIQTADPWT